MLMVKEDQRLLSNNLSNRENAVILSGQHQYNKRITGEKKRTLACSMAARQYAFIA
jgi:hypothetical protein